MEYQNEHQSPQQICPSQFTKSQYLKRTTQLLLSVSVFSFLLSNSTHLPFLHSFNFHFSTFPLQLLCHNIDKRYMFLLCNGLLVFVAKCSGLFSSSSKYNNNNKNIEFESFKYYEDESSPLLEKEVNLVEKTIEEKVQEKVLAEHERQNDHCMNIGIQVEDIKKTQECVVEEEEEEEEESESGFLIVGREVKEIEGFVEEDNRKGVGEEEEKEEEEEEEETIGVLSTEELNKKFEEFIRKMKEEIRIEAQQQQLVMVK